MKLRMLTVVLLSVLLAACEEAPLLAVGQLESDRVELVAESNEPITTIGVTEGDSLQAGDSLLAQDVTRIQIRRAELQAVIDHQQAVLRELENGPRQETIAATRASLREARVEYEYREREVQRAQGLLDRDLTSQESVDLARMQFNRIGARIEQVEAQLAELEAGTRGERIDQARYQLAQSQQQLRSLAFDEARLTVKAPVAGTVDSLPFEVGERPRIGDVVAVLLTGEQPHARVYIPEPVRTTVQPGSQLQVHVDGLERPLVGTIRRIASESSFTPYFALTERDRSRLSYVAEVTLPPAESRLPEGLPVYISFERP